MGQVAGCFFRLIRPHPPCHSSPEALSYGLFPEKNPKSLFLPNSNICFIVRELLNPSPAFEMVLDKYVKPHKDLLLVIIVDIMQADPGPEKLMPCAISIIGQCIYYALGSTVIRKISADSAPTEDKLDQLADSVWLFSLGGIARIKEDFLSAPKVSI
jgi:hypothetical protein